MAEQIESQIKKPLVKTEQTQTTESVEKGTTQAIKKALPKVANALGTAVTAPVKFTGNAISKAVQSSVDTISKPINSGFEKIKDLSADLIVDMKGMAQDILDPGALTTMMTGSPLLGNMLSQSISNIKDAFVESYESTQNSINDRQSDRQDNQINSKISTNLDTVVAGIDIANGLLAQLVGTFNFFSKAMFNIQQEQLEETRLNMLRQAEQERERLLQERKKILPVQEEEKPEQNESLLESIFHFQLLKNTIGSILGTLGPFGRLLKSFLPFSLKGLKMLGKATGVIGIVLGAVSGLIEAFKVFKNGGSITEAISTFLVEFVKGFLEIPAMLIDWIAGLFGFELNLTKKLEEWTQPVIEGLTTTINWVKDFFVGFFEGIFNIGKWLGDKIATVVNFYIDVYKWIWDKIKTGFDLISNAFEKMFTPLIEFFDWVGNTFSSMKDKVKSWLPSWLGGSDDKDEKLINDNTSKIELSKESVKPIIERSKQITELQQPVQMTVINNNTNNMTQMSNNNAVGKTNMIVQSTLRNMDPTFNQSLMSSYIPNM